jgi:sugar/nucleoside kinase (ribokinase family)
VFGKLLIKTIKEAGIETSGIVKDPLVFTTLAFVTLDATGDRSFSFARKPGADTCLRYDELDLSLIDNSMMLHFGTLSLTNEPAREATKKAIEYAKAAGKLITFDPNLRVSLWDDLKEAKKQMLWGLTKADIVKISDEEVEFLWNCGEQEAAAILLDEYKVKLAMVTCGPNGAYVRNKTASAFAVCPPVKPVDTTGAGDIFGGSAVSRIIQLNKAPEELDDNELAGIVSFAVTAASLSTQKPGGIPSVPEEDEVHGVLAEIGKDN